MTKEKQIEQDKITAIKLFGGLVEDIFRKKDPYQKYDKAMLMEYRDSLISLYPYRKEILKHPLRHEQSPTLTVGSKLGQSIVVEFGFLFYASKKDQILSKGFPDYKVIHIKTAKEWLDYKNKKEEQQVDHEAHI